jgi:hypothetical protein
MKAYRCDLCEKFHTEQHDTNEFMLRVDEVTYNDLCQACLRWLQIEVRERKEIIKIQFNEK